jgi:hypothetical protein
MFGHMPQNGQLPIDNASAADDEIALLEAAEALCQASSDDGRSPHRLAPSLRLAMPGRDMSTTLERLIREFLNSNT